ncbi:MAG: DPP IV N-terminal domain-containing protein [Cytophagales bacterium]|nr:DPP IV N-terminal domain-containing protein [Cytophagales bacterium]
MGGPGTGGFFGGANVGWLADNKTVWFQSEESGYSHLYTADITTNKKKSLTSGKFEVQSVDLSRDKNSFTSSPTKYTRVKNIFINSR